MIRPAFLAVVSTLALGAALPAFAADGPTAETAAPANVLPAITVSEVASVTLSDRVFASGLVAAVEEVEVSPLVEGQSIEELLADIGDVVAEGQVLARLSNSTLNLQRSELLAQRAATEAAIAQSRANLIEASSSATEARRVADRNLTLLEQGTIPSATAEQTSAAADAAEARVKVAEQGIVSAEAQLALVDAQLATLDLQLARTEVKSPAAGVVIDRNATVGAIASGAGQPMFTLIRDGAMELRAEVSEGDLLRVQPGQVVRLTGMGWAEPLAGTVRSIDPAIDTATRLGQVRIALDNPEQARVGMFLSAEILVSQAEMLAIPVSAVSSAGDGARVMRVRDGLVEQVSVTTGVRDGGMIGILSGLEPGDLVVTKAASFVRPGDRIAPVADTATAIATASEG